MRCGRETGWLRKAASGVPDGLEQALLVPPELVSHFSTPAHLSRRRLRRATLPVVEFRFCFRLFRWRVFLHRIRSRRIGVSALVQRGRGGCIRRRRKGDEAARDGEDVTKPAKRCKHRRWKKSGMLIVGANFPPKDMRD